MFICRVEIVTYYLTFVMSRRKYVIDTIKISVITYGSVISLYLMYYDIFLLFSVTVGDIKTKLQSFRTIMCREMTKLAKCQNSDVGMEDKYISTYSHWHELQFLRAVIRHRRWSPSKEMVRFCYL